MPCIGLDDGAAAAPGADRGSLAAATTEGGPRWLGRVQADVEGAAVDLDGDDALARLACRPTAASIIVVR